MLLDPTSQHTTPLLLVPPVAYCYEYVTDCSGPIVTYMLLIALDLLLPICYYSSLGWLILTYMLLTPRLAHCYLDA